METPTTAFRSRGARRTGFEREHRLAMPITIRSVRAILTAPAGINLADVFPGCPEVREGYMYPNDRPGLGVDLDEALAARFPPVSGVDQWTQARLPDGTPARP